MENTYFERQETVKTEAKQETIAFLLSYSKSLYIVDRQKHQFEVALN